MSDSTVRARAALNDQLSAVTLGLVMMGGLWQVTLALLNPATLADVPGTWADFRQGRMTNGFATQLDQHLPARETLIAVANTGRYVLTRGAGDQVRAGQEGWLYLTQELRFEAQAADHLQARTTLLAQTAAALKTQGVQLVVALVPDKARMVAQHLPTGTYPDYNQARYGQALAALQAQGVTVVDLRAVLGSTGSDEPLYYRTDTHWNQAGARRAAQAVAASVRGVAPALEPTPFETVVQGPAAQRPGDLLRMMGMDQVPDALRPRADFEAPVQTRQTRADAPAGLFGDASVPVVLSGTSYSLRGNFHGYLQEALQAKVLNVARDGGGFIQSAADYLADESFQQSKPSVLVWELPERFLTLALDEREKKGLSSLLRQP